MNIFMKHNQICFLLVSKWLNYSFRNFFEQYSKNPSYFNSFLIYHYTLMLLQLFSMILKYIDDLFNSHKSLRVWVYGREIHPSQTPTPTHRIVYPMTTSRNKIHIAIQNISHLSHDFDNGKPRVVFWIIIVLEIIESI